MLLRPFTSILPTVGQHHPYSTTATPVGREAKFHGIVLDDAIKLFGEVFHPPQHKSAETPVFLLHGLLGSHYPWKRIARIISQDLNVHVHAIDLREHGRSPRTGFLTYNLMMKDLLLYMKDHSFEKAVVVGHDLGGKVAMYSALAQGQFFDRIVAIDTAPSTQDEKQEEYTKFVEILKGFDLSKAKTRYDVEEYVKQHHMQVPQEFRDFLFADLALDWWNHEWVWRVNLYALENSLKQLKSIPIHQGAIYGNPALFLAAERSNNIKPADHEMIKKFFPNSKIEVVKNVGHFMHLEKPETVANKITEFIQKQFK
jgi:pimeloyl-ACP methyl ester carboxylesterase